MDNQRIILLLGVALMSFWLYGEWETFQAKANNPAPVVAEGDTPKTPADTALTPPVDGTPGTDDGLAVPNAETTAPSDVQTPAAASNLQPIYVETDLYQIQIDPRGGQITSLKLKHYTVSVDDASLFPILARGDNKNPLKHYARTTVHNLTKSVKPPNADTVYTSAQPRYEMTGDTMAVVLTSARQDGVQLERTYTFSKGSYTFAENMVVRNDNAKAIKVTARASLIRNSFIFGNDNAMLPTYTGGAIYHAPKGDDFRFEKVDFDEMEDKREQTSRLTKGGWAGMLQHYFLAAMIPAQDVENSFYPSYRNGLYFMEYISGAQSIAPGATAEFKLGWFFGPKREEILSPTAPGLEETIDYGILSVISEPLFWVMKKIYSVVNSWGVTIILITILIKLLFYRLTQAQYRSMAKMRRFAPRLKEIRERYKDDRQQQSQKMMELYKKEKLNPFGGCLPILVQIPVFISLYYALLESVELRQASFLWLPDLSVSDPYFILPILFAGATFIQQKISMASAAMDPMQQKVMMFMPLMFAVLFVFFPAGLVLYWVVNTGLGIAQQVYITRQVDREMDKPERVRR